jgi:hypothetical protein
LLCADDRKGAGILPDLSVLHNVSIGILERIQRGILVDRKQEQAVMSNYGSRLSIRYSSLHQIVSSVSGGNQQKVILARALAEDCKVLLLAEPTRGVDVGAKAEIYTLIDMLVEAGCVAKSSELPGVIRLAVVHCLCRGAAARRTERERDHAARSHGPGYRIGQWASGFQGDALMADVRRIFIKLWRSYSIAPVVLLVGIVLSLLTPRFLQVGNLLNVLTNASVVAIVGLGMTLAIAGGMFDLSVASTAAFAGCIAFNLIPTFGVGVGVLGGLIVGAIIGG